MIEWKAHLGPQTEFLESDADEVFYGGAAGGGKSDALLAEAACDMAQPGFHALLLRRTYPELEGKGSGLIPRSHELWRGMGGSYDRQKQLWTFPSGATVGFGHLEHADSVFAYHSAQFAYIGFDELTTFLESQYLYLLSRLRSPAGIRARMRAAGNPGGIGHAWVRRRFVEKLRPGEVRWFKRAGPLPTPASSTEPSVSAATQKALAVRPGERRGWEESGEASGWETGAEEGADVETTASDPDGMSRQYIPARVFDNPSLLAKDPGYVRRLKALDPVDRMRLLEGDWWVQNTGAVYREFNDENITNEEPEPGAPIELAFDEGYVDPRVFLFIQRRGDRFLIADEMFHTKHLGAVCVAEVLERCKARGWPRPVIAVGSPEAAELREVMRRANIPARGMATPIMEGIGAVRRLVCDANGYRVLRIHRRCTRLLAELQGGYQYATGNAQHDHETPLDQDNHGADALRYWVWMRGRRR